MSNRNGGTQLVPADHLRPVAGPNRVGQATAVEQSRAVAEVQAAVLVAQQMPRDVELAKAEMRRSCSEFDLADRAFYRFRRGTEQVSGASIHLARELARCWGNIDYGIAELRRDDDAGQSEMKAWAWDQQTNARPSTTFIVPHGRDLRSGERVPLTALRDIYENNANMGGRRVREMIFAVLPVWFVKEAERLCRETIERGDGTPLEQRIEKLVAAFSKLGVSQAQIEAKVGRPRHLWTAFDVADLTVVGQSIRAGEATAGDEFPVDPERVTLDEIQAQPPAPAPEAGPPVAMVTDGPAVTPDEEAAPARAEQEMADPDPEPVTLDDLLNALRASGRVPPKCPNGRARADLLVAGQELVGIAVGIADQLVTDQTVAGQLLAALQLEASTKAGL